MRLNETCNMIIEQEYIENVVFSQPDGLRLGLRSGIKKRKDSARTNIIKNIKHQATTMPL